MAVDTLPSASTANATVPDIISLLVIELSIAHDFLPTDRLHI
jgi:hypothetical protein